MQHNFLADSLVIGLLGCFFLVVYAWSLYKARRDRKEIVVLERDIDSEAIIDDNGEETLTHHEKVQRLIGDEKEIKEMHFDAKIAKWLAIGIFTLAFVMAAVSLLLGQRLYWNGQPLW